MNRPSDSASPGAGKGGGMTAPRSGAAAGEAGTTAASAPAGPPPLVIGTAGHVDHGKTTLVRALTGVDTDRLQEEKRRGISIDLGFAPFRLPSGRPAAIVDVPGHERFVHNMAAGVHGMDLVLLVVAADEGVMPQTVEHLDILQLLGVRHGLVVLTKVDLVDDPAWLDLVEEDVRAHLRDTFLAEAPVVRVAPPTGQGLDRLLTALEDAARRVPGRDADGLLRLPIDRAFTLPGFGPVVTGTLVAGRVRVGDRVEVQPGGLTARIRHLQVHGREVEEAVAGQRVAANLVGVDHQALHRGQVLVRPGTLEATRWLAVRLQWLPRAPWPLRHQERVRVHAGAAEVLGRVRLLEPVRPWKPGEAGWALIRLEEPLVVAPGDRFVVRTYSPARTAGGGVVADVGRVWSRRHTPGRWLAAFLADDPADGLTARLERAGLPRPATALARELGQPIRRIEQALARAEAAGRVRSLPGGHWVAAPAAEALARQARATLERHHQERPLEAGMSRDALLHALWRAARGAADARTGDRPVPEAEARAGLQALLETWIAAGVLAADDDRLRLPDWEPGGTAADRQHLERLAAVYRQGGLAPPASAEEAAATAGVPVADALGLLSILERQGRVVRVDTGLWFTPEALVDAWRRLVALERQVGPFTVAQARDALGVTRKWALPLLEYFDRRRWTRREGDLRRVVGGPDDEPGDEDGTRSR